jgi:branched-chain amino acid transport system substrate-binding protein
MAVSRPSIVVVTVALALGALGATFASFGGSPPAPVNVGAIYSLTGPDTGSRAGRDALDGARFAVDYINGGHDPESTLPLAAGGGLPRLGGAKLDLVVADANGDRCQGQPAFNRLVDRSHVAAVVGAI